MLQLTRLMMVIMTSMLVNVYAANDNKVERLLAAAFDGHIEKVRELLDSGADVKAYNIERHLFMLLR